MDSRVPPTATPTLADSLAAAQASWREAGVDLAYAEEPHGWLADPRGADAPATSMAQPAPSAPPPPAEPPIGGDRALWPHDLAGFARWWLEEPSLDHGGTHPRIAPRGPVGAPLMLLVPMPEQSDGDSLLQGAQGRLVASLATAMGYAPETVYLAAALPRHMAMPDWAGLAARGYGEVLRHHLALAAPARLVVLGRNILPLLGHDPTQAAPFVDQMAIQDRQLPLMATYAPERLLGNWRWRSQLWQRWLEWTEGDRG
jgi:DNA polymerase